MRFTVTSGLCSISFERVAQVWWAATLKRGEIVRDSTVVAFAEIGLGVIRRWILDCTDDPSLVQQFHDQILSLAVMHCCGVDQDLANKLLDMFESEDRLAVYSVVSA